MPLPKSLKMDTLLDAPLPGDISIGEARKFAMNSKAIAFIKKQSSRPDAVRIRFLNPDGNEIRDEMLLRDVRHAIKVGIIHIVVDDGEGEIPVSA